MSHILYFAVCTELVAFRHGQCCDLTAALAAKQPGPRVCDDSGCRWKDSSAGWQQQRKCCSPLFVNCNADITSFWGDFGGAYLRDSYARSPENHGRLQHQPSIAKLGPRTMSHFHLGEAESSSSPGTVCTLSVAFCQSFRSSFPVRLINLENSHLSSYSSEHLRHGITTHPPFPFPFPFPFPAALRIPHDSFTPSINEALVVSLHPLTPQSPHAACLVVSSQVVHAPRTRILNAEIRRARLHMLPCHHRCYT
jgi:hypothetical protein